MAITRGGVVVSDVLDLLRWANAFLFVVVAAGFAHRVRHRWGRQLVSEKRFSVALVTLLLVSAYGSLESYFQQVGTGPRIPLVTLALLGLAHGLWSHPHEPAD